MFKIKFPSTDILLAIACTRIVGARTRGGDACEFDTVSEMGNGNK